MEKLWSIKIEELDLYRSTWVNFLKIKWKVQDAKHYMQSDINYINGHTVIILCIFCEYKYLGKKRFMSGRKKY